MARSILDSIDESDSRVAGWKSRLARYTLQEAYPEEPYAYLICVLALLAVAEGNGGIGCVIVDEDGGSLVFDHNKVIHPYFRSDLHGEMVTMNRFEELRLDVSPRELTLYSSLEPCPMCMVRMITSGIGRVLYLADDPDWGMTRDREKLPPAWRELAEGTVFGKIDCSQELREASSRIFKINIDELYELFKNR